MLGVLEAEGRQSLAAYLTRQTKNRPYVTLKLAVSADGMIGRQGAGQVAITGPEARAQVQALRAETDAILVGIGTAIADDPLLTVRSPGLESQSPIRIVLDPSLALPLTSRLVGTAREVPVIVVTSEEGSLSQAEGDITSTEMESRRAALEAAGVEVVHCNPYHPEVLLLGTRDARYFLASGRGRCEDGAAFPRGWPGRSHPALSGACYDRRGWY